MNSFRFIGGACLRTQNNPWESYVQQVKTNLWDSYVNQVRQRNDDLRRRRLSAAGRLGAWRRWKREQKILELLPMVERISKNVRWMFAPHLDFRDLTQAGSVGLVNAANSYHPAKGEFEPYAWFRVRGAIIDSQKRRVYREESNVSLQAIEAANDGWLPPALDIDRAPLADAIAEREEIHRILAAAIAGLPTLEQRVLRGHLDGQSLAATAHSMGRSLTWTRAKLAEAREQVTVRVRGQVS